MEICGQVMWLEARASQEERALLPQIGSAILMEHCHGLQIPLALHVSLLLLFQILWFAKFLSYQNQISKEVGHLLPRYSARMDLLRQETRKLSPILHSALLSKGKH